MKTTLPVSILSDVIDLVRWFVSRHATLPVLENVYIKWSEGHLTFRATDMEKYIEIKVPATLEDEGALTVSAKTFSDIVKSLDGESVTLTIEESETRMSIVSATDDFMMNGISANEYVSLPQVESDDPITLDTQQFTTWVSKVEYAVTEKNFSPVLTWVFMRITTKADASELTFVGTDSFRLAEYKISLDQIDQEVAMIIPKIHINELKRVAEYALQHGAEVVTCKAASNMVEFSYVCENMQISTSTLLIQWSFPDYEQEAIMPTSRESKSTINAKALDKAIKKIGILTRDLNNYIAISWSTDRLTMNSWRTDRWNAETQVSALVEWADFTFGVNGKYFSDFLKFVENDEVIMRVIDSEKPIILQDENDTHMTYVVRPLVK